MDTDPILSFPLVTWLMKMFHLGEGETRAQPLLEKEEERHHLRLFLNPRQRVTEETLDIIRSDESPDFLV